MGMKNLARRIASVIAALIVVSGVAVVHATPAAAAAPCGSACDWTDPSMSVWANNTYYTCSLGTVTTPYSYSSWSDPLNIIEPGIWGWVEMRYSPHCRTVWGRGDFDSYQETILIEVYDLNGNFLRRDFDFASGNWTVQFNDAGLRARVCWAYWDDTQTYLTNRYCTPKY
jgi:hypothetical protein